MASSPRMAPDAGGGGDPRRGAAAPDSRAPPCAAGWRATRRSRRSRRCRASSGAQGYADGRAAAAISGPMCAGCLRAWRARGLHLAVYSSGTVTAQRLLFRHSRGGRPEPASSTGFFDTAHGRASARPPAYRRIAAAWGAAPARASCSSPTWRRSWTPPRAAGPRTCQLVRAADGTQPCRPPPGGRRFRRRDSPAARVTAPAAQPLHAPTPRRRSRPTC